MNSDSSPDSARSEPQPRTTERNAGPDKRPEIPATLPILPTRDVAVFPGIVASISIGRPASRKLLEESLPQSKIIGLFAQKNPENDKPGIDDLFGVGVACSVHKLMRQPDDSGVIIVVSALERIAIRKVLSSEPFLRAEIEVLHSTPPPADDKQWQAMLQQWKFSIPGRIGHLLIATWICHSIYPR
ncbi:MAG: LON peptidase substrate-binding domain-containing protein [Opitutaceae bacterium]